MSSQSDKQLSELDRLASQFLVEYRLQLTKREKEEESESSERIEIEADENFDSPSPQFCVIASNNGANFLYGHTPTGRAVWGANIQNAQVFEIGEEFEQVRSLGVGLPAPWFLISQKETR